MLVKDVLSKIRQLKFEQWLGGSMALVAAVALILELCVGDQKPLTFVRLFAGLMVSIIVLIVAVRAILAQVAPKDTFESVLHANLDTWVTTNHPLVSKNQDAPAYTSYLMLADHEYVFAVGASTDAHKEFDKRLFATLPLTYKKGNSIMFHIDKAMFVKRAAANNHDIDTELDILAAKISACINANFSKFIKASPVLEDGNINVLLLRDLKTTLDARKVRRLLYYAMTLYIVAE